MSRCAGKKTGKKIADEETAQKIIAALENESIKYETYFKLIIATGMWRGECCALQWRDIATLDIYTHAFDKSKKAASAGSQGMLEIWRRIAPY